MANPIMAKKHHRLAGLALAAGDHKKAAHHLGHAMSALRTNAPMAVTKVASPVTDVAPPTDVPSPPKSTIRGILSRFKIPNVGA